MANPDSNCSVAVKSLFKIYGAEPRKCVELLRNGRSKDEILKKHNHVVALNDVNIRIPSGSIQVIMGLSGSGKSTLVRHFNRLIDPTAGSLVVNGVDVTRLNLRELQKFRSFNTAMVFQKFALLPHRTVLDNVVYGLSLRGLPVKDATDRGLVWLERVGLRGYEKRYPSQLSGGMQQRVGLARALAMDAPLLLMDEAFSALDPIIRVDMQNILLELQKDLRKTIVFITHDLDEALRLGDQIAILKDGEIVQQGRAQDILTNPATEYVRNFVGEVNRGRFLRVEAGMSPLRDAVGAPAVRIPLGTTMETAMKAMAENEAAAVCIVDEHTTPVGTLDWKTAVSLTVK
ncbi:MAG TPA: betaine/proline/choline family ABC transporter ATP-binding protein [Ochrobactrum intermedium]|uniref:Quaternary amine transport ATP-binding protein n=1 Tax=Brucella intermedia TaxID=94625 RepID=A0A7V6PA65_9HYPH|nr:betaine/proline/choline family ABC transporter ATP-binding protein [Brucella intermedia]HHV67033.1 betaine/proline/choline family ABC transporter ATP-binding protein [Brucella intermedia]